MATTKKQTAKKECIVIARYAFKTNKVLNGHICTLIRTSEGKEHKVWTHQNDCSSSCDCECFEKSHGRRKCYHINFAEAREAARKSIVAAQPRELRNVTSNGDLLPEYLDENGAWRHFKNEEGHNIIFVGGWEDLARKFIQIDSDAHRAAVLAEMRQKIADYVAAEDASKAASQQRMNAPLNSNQGFSLLKKTA